MTMTEVTHTLSIQPQSHPLAPQPANSLPMNMHGVCDADDFLTSYQLREESIDSSRFLEEEMMNKIVAGG